MTDTDLNELDAGLARACGYEQRGTHPPTFGIPGSPSRMVVGNDEDQWMTHAYRQWHPTRDHNHFAEVLAEIERRGVDFQIDYAEELRRSAPNPCGVFIDIYALFAPLPTRCRAALAALTEAK